MSSMKTIKTKINSVKNIKKMTRALEIVSTVKLQKIKQKTENYRNFLEEFLRIAQVIHTQVNLFGAVAGSDTPSDKTLCIVLGTEKGLCGSINSKLFKTVFSHYEPNKELVDIFCIGKKALDFFTRTGFSIAGTSNISDEVVEDELKILYTFLFNAIHNRTYKNITISFNYFKNIIKQVPSNLQIYPFEKKHIEDFVEQIGDININHYLHDTVASNEFIFEPTISVVKEEFMKQFIQHLMYGAILQNKAGEFSARMLAMKNAKDNAGNIIDDLTMAFNKARQGIITQEISEIVSAKIALE